MSQSLSQLYVHIIFHVNFAETVKIPDELQPILHAYLATICKNHNSPAIIIGGIDDHIHILSRISKNIAPAKLLEEIKTASSRWIKMQSEEYGAILSKFSWQKGYGIFSVSASQLEIVKKYILTQKKHHEKISTKDEYIIFLEKYGIEYNNKYLWS